MMLTTLQFMFFCFRVLLICSLFFFPNPHVTQLTLEGLYCRDHFFFVIGIHAVHYFPLLLQRPIPIPPCLQRGPRTCPDPY